MKKNLISVVVPLYNVEKYLPYSIEQIINQTYTNLEIILVNDGSTDNSKLICERYKNKDKRIKLINQQNKGLSVARNVGIENATGDYISFIDSDDIISIKFYEVLYKLLVETNSDIAECVFKEISEQDVFNNKYDLDNTNDLSYSIVDLLGAFHRIHNEKISVIRKASIVCNKLYKKNLFDDIRFPEGKRYEDDFTIYKIINKINQLVSTEKVLYYYVQRENSIMHQPFSLKRLDALEAYDNHVEFFKTYPDKYLFSKCLLRYLRLLVKILEELYKSSYEDKESVKTILQNKFKEISFLLEDTVNQIDSKKTEYVLENKIIYTNKFYEILKNNI